MTGGERAGGALFGITRVTLSGSVEEEYDEFLDELKVRGYVDSIYQFAINIKNIIFFEYK